MNDRTKRRTKLLLGIAAFYIALWLLWLTPVVFPLRIFVVLLHEVSHALAALATGGTVDRILLNADEGGVTYTRGGSAFLILSAGYLGSLLWGLMLIEVAGARPRRVRIGLALLALFVIAIALLYVRNLFGFVFTLVFGGALLLCAWRLGARGVSTVLLTLGLTSALYALLDIRSDILARPHVESDAVMLGQLTHTPGVMWGILWVAVALAACWLALRRWLRRA